MERTRVAFQWVFLWRERNILASGMAILVPFVYCTGVSGIRLAYVSLFLAMILLVSAMDCRYGLIFDRFLLAMGILGLCLGGIGSGIPLWDAALGAFLGGTLLFLVRQASCGGMGGGDVKYAFVLGLWLGWKFLLMTLFLAFLAGGIAAVFLLCCRSGQDSIPFAPFLSLGAFSALLYGTRLLQWYGEAFL